MFDKINRTNPLQVLTLDEAKQQLNIIDFNDDDELILELIATAGDMAEKYTNLLYSQCTVQLEVLACENRLMLRYPPFDSVTSVLSEQGDELNYNFSSFSGALTFSSLLPADEKVIITYVAGYTEIPKIVKQACRIIVSDLYNNRDSQVQDKMTSTTFNALRLLR